MMALLRNLLFFSSWSVFTVFYCTAVLIATLFVPAWKPKVGIYWGHISLWLLRVLCGVEIRVIQESTMPTGGCVILSNHQSTFETIFFLILFPKHTWLLKKQLLSIPFFGWALRLLRPIAIDRSSRISAMKTLLKEGAKRLCAGEWIVIFPQGTRMPYGVRGTLHRGGAQLVVRNSVPFVCVVHDAGRIWPRGSLIRPGHITVHVSAAQTATDTTQVETQFIAFLDAHDASSA